MKKNIMRRPFKYRFYNVALILIAINIGVFMLTQTSERLSVYLSLSVIGIHEGYFFQFLTYMFTHASFGHLVGNMLTLLIFGVAVEKAIGSKEFILFYLVIGLLCGITSLAWYWISGGYLNFLLGASGAVYGVLLLYAVLFPQSKIYIWGILPIPAPLLVLIYGIITIYSQMFSRNTGIAHLAHLSGFVFAWIYLQIRMGINPLKIWKGYFR